MVQFIYSFLHKTLIIQTKCHLFLYLSSIDKYYLVDQTFKHAKLGIRNVNYGRVYENIVAIELLRRGYEIYVGTLYNKQVLFKRKE